MRFLVVPALVALVAGGAVLALAMPASEVIELTAPARFAPRGAPAAAGAMAYVELAAEDPSLRVLAGVARAPSVLGLAVGAAPERVLAVPLDAPADLAGMVATRTFAFTDPHGHAWEVQQYEAPWGSAWGTRVGPLTHDPDAGAYNFVLLVDGALAIGGLRLVAA